MSNTKPNFDAARYCRHNTGRMGKWMDGEDIAGMIAEEMEMLRAELAALKKAARPMAMGWGMVKKDGEDAVLNCAGSGYRISADALDALAALVGEEK